jgi:prolyl-tRNA synthetase
VVSLDEIATKLTEILESIQQDMYTRAKEHLDAHVHTAVTMEEMIRIAQEETGFMKAMWCGDAACEEGIKTATGGVTSRCIPDKEESLSDVCICCGKPAKHMVYWGKAY